MARVCDHCGDDSNVQLCNCGLDACAGCWRNGQCFDCDDADRIDGAGVYEKTPNESGRGDDDGHG